LVRLLSTEAATNTTVSTSAITLTAACGDGFHPRSANPKSPTVRESANATSAPADSTPATHRSQSGPPARISRARTQKTMACPKNPRPIVGMSR
jgi:hypothetical protein